MASRSIYFCGSIRGGREDALIYFDLIKHLQQFGNVLTEHVGSKNTNDDGIIKDDEQLTDKEIHDRDIKWLKQCDTVVAEVTTASLGVGYEIGCAVHMNKNIVCLYREMPGKRLSAMIKGAENEENFQVWKYSTVEDACSKLDAFFKSL